MAFRQISTLSGVLEETQILQRGSRSAAVGELQRILTNIGTSPGPIDNIFGPLTEEALQRAQKAAGLEPTGRLDIPTRSALKAMLAQQTSVPQQTADDDTSSNNVPDVPQGPSYTFTSSMASIANFFKAPFTAGSGTTPLLVSPSEQVATARSQASSFIRTPAGMVVIGSAALLGLGAIIYVARR